VRRVGAIDVGTNTVLACVVERDGDCDRLLSDEARITRLGEGVGASRHLADAAIARTLAVLSELCARARARGAERVHAVGTSALRDAANRDAFVREARGMVDAFTVIDGAREAELTFRGALFGLREADEAVTVVDIGGGSTEIVRGVRGMVMRACSLDVGSVRLTERHALTEARASDAQLAAMRSEIDAALSAIAVEPPLVMVAGTATNVAAVALARDLAHGEPAPHGEILSSASFRESVRRITASTRAERLRTIGIEPGRHDVIVAGALILERIVDRSGATEVTISDGGVRFGLALELLT
jgi:exopolyphosphatase/guanosine-5'-triphosphate,3'-diphosphate pyrophosphatase